MHMLDVMLPVDFLHQDKGYDSDALRRPIEVTGAAPNIPPKRTGVGNHASRRRLSLLKHHRAYVRAAQGLPTHHHSIRQIGAELPRRRLRRRYRLLLVMSPEPSITPIGRIAWLAWRNVV